MTSFIQEFDDKAKNYLEFLDNKYIHAILAIFLVTYASVAAPKLPDFLLKIMDNIFFKFLIFFLIAHITGSSLSTSIISALFVLVILQLLVYFKGNENLENPELPKITAEDFIIHDNVSIDSYEYLDRNKNDIQNL